MLKRVISKRKNFTFLMIGISLVSIIGLLVGCSRTYSSNGERIYFTATSSSGDPITYTGSITMMHSIACANCHGADGRGGRVNMMMWSFDTPEITWEHLTSEKEHDEQEPDEEHEDHPPYTEETVKQAITKGIEPNGEELDSEMPRWRMSQDDLDDLVDFLKTLD